VFCPPHARKCDKLYGNGRDWKECSTCTSALFCGPCIKSGYFVAHEKNCGKVTGEEEARLENAVQQQ
jgi:hypothetical protein